MNTCEQCGKSMATRGGLEIHMELAHAPTPAPVAAPMAPQPVAAMPEGALPRRVIAAPRPPAVEWHMPTFLRGIDPTVPLTALLVMAILFAGVLAAVHRA